MAEYQGHPSYEHWNVFLYLSNDFQHYSTVQALNERGMGSADIATVLMSVLPTSTADGVRYTHKLVRYAVAEMLLD